MYKLVVYQLRNGSTKVGSIQVVGQNKFIPLDPNNSDYQRYLAWVAEGNEPLPADPLPSE